MEIYPIIGLIILVTTFATQLIKVLWTKRVAGISPWAMVQLLVCCLLFMGYYFGNGHFLALGLNLVLMVIVIGILWLYKKQSKACGGGNQREGNNEFYKRCIDGYRGEDESP